MHFIFLDARGIQYFLPPSKNKQTNKTVLSGFYVINSMLLFQLWWWSRSCGECGRETRIRGLDAAYSTRTQSQSVNWQLQTPVLLMSKLSPSSAPIGFLSSEQTTVLQKSKKSWSSASIYHCSVWSVLIGQNELKLISIWLLLYLGFPHWSKHILTPTFSVWRTDPRFQFKSNIFTLAIILWNKLNLALNCKHNFAYLVFLVYSVSPMDSIL